MADPQERHNWLGPYIPQGSVIREVVQQLRLAYALLADARVPLWPKLIPAAALAYLLLPVDLVPDLLVGLGQLDDVAILMLGLRTFFEFAPPAVVHEHLRRLSSGAGGEAAPPPASGEVVDGTFTVKSQDE